MPIRTITIPVKDLAAAKALYADLLGTQPYVDEPYYVGFRPANSPEIGLNPHGDVAAGPITYYHVPDIEATIRTLTAAGATLDQPAKPVGGGATTATLRDTDGNVIGLYQGDPQ
ncbi:glyoxalase [Paractinoplanes deccanensis]|uniref:Glyoxalase n=1 Tax=Paractinoplanes deccanensis TaxID=113561 RepID=A0ABQ3YGL5_9ACTN|nr:VOC family protein [Actinoplanes deccanensis]GID79154.1 glyoxalase [Actinoplanes deccanensis]